MYLSFLSASCLYSIFGQCCKILYVYCIFSYIFNWVLISHYISYPVYNKTSLIPKPLYNCILEYLYTTKIWKLVIPDKKTSPAIMTDLISQLLLLFDSSLRLAPSHKGVAVVSQSLNSPPLLIRDIYNILLFTFTTIYSLHVYVK